MAKRKMPFIKLSIIFAIMIILAIFYSWGNRDENDAQPSMMDQSMGNMIGENHLKDITVRDLIIQEEQSQTVQNQANEDSNTSHHDSNGSFLKTLNKITTITIVILLPFIIAGSVFLLIIWFDTP